MDGQTVYVVEWYNSVVDESDDGCEDPLIFSSGLVGVFSTLEDAQAAMRAVYDEAVAAGYAKDLVETKLVRNMLFYNVFAKEDWRTETLFTWGKSSCEAFFSISEVKVGRRTAEPINYL